MNEPSQKRSNPARVPPGKLTRARMRLVADVFRCEAVVATQMATANTDAIGAVHCRLGELAELLELAATSCTARLGPALNPPPSPGPCDCRPCEAYRQVKELFA